MIFKIGICVIIGQLSGTYPHLAETPPHVHSTLLLSILLIGLLLIIILIHRLPLRLRVLHLVLQLQVQDLDRLLQGCVGSYIWGKRSLS